MKMVNYNLWCRGLKKIILPILAWSCITAPSFAAGEQPIETFTLKNGMEVIVLPNHRVPAVNHMLWYRIGAADDPQGKSGLAHFHEHLMFKGSPKFGAGEYVRLIDKNGGEHNAFTGDDATSYYVTIAKDRLPLVMAMEADRMRALTVSETETEKEKQVIIEERRSRIENSPQALLNEQIAAALFRNHPYRLPAIGWLHEIETLTHKDALDFHAQYYHPNNAVLIVSGDITSAELKPLAKQYYGNLKQMNVPARAWLSEPPSIAARSVTLHHKHVKQPQLKRVYEAANVSAGKPQAHALYVLAHVLGGGKNSVLYQSLVVEKKLASEVSADYDFFARGPAQFSIDITPEQGITLAQIEAVLGEELTGFLKVGVGSESLARTKRLMQADTIYAREGLTSISNIMGWMVMTDMPPEDFNRWPDMIAAVSGEEVLAAAKQLLTRRSSVTGYLLPESEGQ